MQFKTASIGDKRTRTFFCWLPVEHNHIVYWLERILVEEEYISYGYDNIWDINT